MTPWWSLLTADLPQEIVSGMTPPAAEPTTAEEAEAALRALSSAAAVVRIEGLGMPAQTGRVAGLFAGDAGLPKPAILVAEISASGVAGDRQRTRKHHGRVWQALCLWSAEVVAELQAEGHPVFPGACGENVSIEGLDWPALRPGTRLRIGSVVAEVSLPTIPCRQIRPYFTGAAVRRVDHDRHRGSSRWYASVIDGGTVAGGDRVQVLG